MAMSDIIVAPRTARYSVVKTAIARQGLTNLGVLLEDPETDALRLRFRRDLDALTDDEEELEVLEALAADLEAKASEMGAAKLFEYLESNASNAVQVTDREEIAVEDLGRALNRLYLQHVQSNVLEFKTHLPRYGLRAAAGKFLDNQEVTEEGWIEAPEDLRLSTDMFVAEIAGHSMEPRIPDGSLCVFRYGVVGSRTGRLVLAEERGGGNDRYAVKRYHSGQAGAEKWIRLESLNPEYPSWDLDPDEDKYRIIAEFIRVID